MNKIPNDEFKSTIQIQQILERTQGRKIAARWRQDKICAPKKQESWLILALLCPGVLLHN